MRPDRRGFSLIELVIVMATASLLTLLAVAAHDRFLQRARRGEALRAVFDIARLQERYIAEHGHYAAHMAQLGRGDVRGTDDYRLTIRPTIGRAGFVAVATAKPDGRQARDTECLTLSLDDTGRRHPDTCWR